MDAIEKVTRGAEWLDKHFPGWEREIDLNTLDLNDCTACICGQSLRKFVVDSINEPNRWGKIFSGYDLAIAAAFGYQENIWVNRDVALDWTIDHGFYPQPHVEETWRELIKERFDSGNLSDVV
jgi:hypothetical protein